MNQELLQYLFQLHHFVQSQEKRILQLEQEIRTFKAELQEVRSRPPIHVDTIEYQFDQLKVETLEGTLNIGLNPSDMEGIEEFAVQNKGINNHFSPKEKMKRSMDLESRIHHYLEEDLEPLIVEYEKDLNKKIDPSYIDFIKEDIKKQLPQRIDHYLKQIPKKERSPEAANKMTEQLFKQMKKDIEQAVFQFITTLPKEGMEKNEPPNL